MAQVGFRARDLIWRGAAHRGLAPRLGAVVALLLLPGLARAQEPAAAKADPAEVVRLLESKLTGVTNVQAGFIQEKQLAMLRQKIVLEGRLALQSPDRMAWHVDKPVRYGLVIQDGFVRQWDEDTDHVQQLSLTRNPVFQVVFQQLDMWFSGHYAALLKDYDVRVLQEHPCVLAFTPKPTAMTAKAIRNVQVFMQDDERYIRELRIEELSGDTSTMVFTNARINTPMDPAVWEVKPRAR